MYFRDNYFNALSARIESTNKHAQIKRIGKHKRLKLHKINRVCFTFFISALCLSPLILPSYVWAQDSLASDSVQADTSDINKKIIESSVPDSSATDSLVSSPPDSLQKTKERRKLLPDSLIDAAVEAQNQYLLSIGADTLVADSLRSDSLKQEKLVKPKSFSYRERKFVPLPEAISLNLTDTASIKAEHYLALEKHFTYDYIKKTDKSLLEVDINQSSLKSKIVIHARPLLQAERKEMVQRMYSSKYEKDLLIKNNQRSFANNVRVELRLRTFFLRVLDVNEEAFDIYMESSGIKVMPVHKQKNPVIYHITDGIPWYERSVFLTFPRRKNGIDLWSDRKISFFVVFRNSKEIKNSSIQTFFEFPIANMEQTND